MQLKVLLNNNPIIEQGGNNFNGKIGKKHEEKFIGDKIILRVQ